MVSRELQPYSDWPSQSQSLFDLYGRIAQGVIPHALLFVGHPASSQKLTEYLTKYMFCTESPAPCGVCAGCVAVAQGNHPDVHVVDGLASGSVKTGAVESLQSSLSRRAHAGGRLVYIIHGIDTATPAAANRLLKTLEEPALPIVAMLTAVHARRVLPTILSRCFTYTLGAGNLWEDPDPASLGGIAQAQPAGTDVQSSGDPFAAFAPAMIQWTRSCLARSASSLELADMFMKSVGDLSAADALHLLSLWLRDVMHVALGQSAYIRFSAHQMELREQAQLASASAIAQVIGTVLDAKLRLQSHVAPLLNVEQMCIRVQRGLANV